jgi:alkylglycerol monooxygenase
MTILCQLKSFFYICMKNATMELYGKILLWAMPAFLLLVFLEKGYGLWRGKDTYHNMDMISSLSSGVTNVVKDVLQLSISLLTYKWMVEHWAIFHLESSILLAIAAFVAKDFKGYVTHRMAHQVNFFWNKHLIHHSSEEFNLSCALRQTVSSFIELFTFFLLPAALLGVPYETMAIISPIHLFAQFWYHTEHIGQMGFLEKIIVTPSHHRVHHAINPIYIDKNFSEIFIIWDKLFGTFQEELPDVKPVYGITHPVRTWNPIKINFQHLALLVSDAWRAEKIEDKFKIWFMPTGWRPADVEAKYPIYKIDDPYNFEKYRPEATFSLNAWAWVQLAFLFILVMYFFGNLGTIQKVEDIKHFFTTPNLLLYGLFVFLSVYAYTELMDRNRYAFLWETIKNVLGLGIIYKYGDWFGISASLSWATAAIATFFVITTIVTTWFCWGFNKKYS